jgi:hypothetical protein
VGYRDLDGTSLDGQEVHGTALMGGITYEHDSSDGYTRITHDGTSLNDGFILCYLGGWCTTITCDSLPLYLYYDTGVPMQIERVRLQG